MPALTEADTIRILVSTDNHVGYNERDPIRGDDSWKSFHEVMCMAKEQDVDMVLLAGDLFHENKPSRKAMFQVMRSLRMNCYGEKPCELEFLSDASENFPGAFDHVNYEDMDINVAIPVFSIHGNHDDPSGEGHLAALDLLQVSGLINYYGRTPESDNIQVKPLLLQKGRTKLALYGMSNVRDERLFRTFKNGHVKFFQPSTQKDDWFNLLSVHQNHHAYTETGYLPENFLPEFLDLVVWGHEHECIIDPRLNPETTFRVMQPGSSVATSLVPGEAVSKHVAILTITGRDFTSENIRLKTVRPFVMKELSLQDNPTMKKIAKKENNRTDVTKYLIGIVDELIEQARNEWLEVQDTNEDEELEVPLPLIRLRVEVTPPEGGSYDTENPQRFSNRFVGKVANTNDVVQFHRRNKNSNALKKITTDDAATSGAISHLEGLDVVKVEKLVREFLAAQSLTILPQNTFGDAVTQFIDKDDKHAVESFVNDSLASQIKHLMHLNKHGDGDDDDEEDEEEEGDDLVEKMGEFRSQLEELFKKGQAKRTKTTKSTGRKYKPRPDGWDSDFEGHWEDQPGSLLPASLQDRNGQESEEEEDDTAQATRGVPATTRGRGSRARGRAGRATITSTRATKSTTTAKKPPPATTTTRGKKRAATISSSNESSDFEDAVAPDIPMPDAGESSDSDALFVTDTKTKAKPTARNGTTRRTSLSSSRASATPAPAPAPIRKPPTRRAAPAPAASKTKQRTLNFGASQASVLGGLSQSQSQAPQSSSSRRKAAAPVEEIKDDSDDDDDDAFEEAVLPAKGKRGGRGR